MSDIYRQIAERTGGEIHLGIIGPVRSGKSTFIRKFMELMVVPGLESDYERQRLRRASAERRRENCDDGRAEVCTSGSSYTRA